ncbi:hypothetical protein Trco_002104 [Trichoderma cornu-damae]|uniref:PWI domain-containing protein n=1 Tax=Trichoderma cornu-damae TaxID=654480 RepID=A0A9P8QU11_9HYPO|nr:hypothetical protein Trco_002104 [Trichoderma cornu-damae]
MASAGDARLMKSTKFPTEFSQKVDMQKVNLQVIKKWIANKISEILGSEDDVVIELCFNLIDGPRHPDIKSLQIQLTGFLDKDTGLFCKELWKLLLSAQSNPQGVPKELLEAKKLELMQEKIEADRAAENARKRREDSDRRDREVTELKDRDRRDRANERVDRSGRRGDRVPEGHGRGGNGWGANRSRSPEPRHPMSPEAEAVEGGIVAGSDDEVARRPTLCLIDPALGVAARLAAIGALGARHAAREGLPDTETPEKGPGLLAAMLTDRGGNRAMGGTAAVLEIGAQNPRSAPLLRRSEGGNLPLEVDRQSADGATRLRRPPVHGAPRKPVAAVPTAAAIDPLIASDQPRLQSAAKNADEAISRRRKDDEASAKGKESAKQRRNSSSAPSSPSNRGKSADNILEDETRAPNP